MIIQRKIHRGKTVQGKPKRKWNLQKFRKMAVTVLLVFVIVIFLLATLGTVAYAAGLVDDTVNTANEYSKYPLDNYQLDFYVDNSWGWLPWNWLDGIGKQVMYGLYAITNFIWTINLYLSNATGYLVQEAYSLDFISATADSIGKNMQTIAGVTTSGLSTDGFYAGFLLILILVVGIYVAYTGLIKRETTKAIHAVVNFVVVFVLSAAFIAYAPDYIGKINDFSSDISNASLSLGTKIVLPNSDSQGKDSVDLIRDSLFSIQVKQPWLLLQFGNSDSESIGTDRVENLLSTSPDTNNGEDREEIVKAEIEDRDNTNLTITKTINRLGTVFFLFLFNIGISVFVFLLTGIMIFSQVLFIIYAMFLPVSFLLSMVPTFDGMGKRAITKLFNTILTRAGITLIITVGFSISTMLYTLSADYPFFLIAFLQIVTFGGIYFKLGDLMSLFSLQSGDSQSMGRQVLRRPRMLMQAHMHRLQHKLGRSVASSAASKKSSDSDSTSSSGASRTTQADHIRPDGQPPQKDFFGKQAGQVTGTAMDTKKPIKESGEKFKEDVQEVPVHARDALYHRETQGSEGVRDFKPTVRQPQIANQEERKDEAQKRIKTIAERRTEMEQAKQRKPSAAEQKKSAAPVHERPAAIIPQEKSREPKGAEVQVARTGKAMERPMVSAEKEQITSYMDKPVKKSSSPAPSEKEPQRRSSKERSFSIQHQSIRQKKSITAPTTKEKGQKL